MSEQAKPENPNNLLRGFHGTRRFSIARMVSVVHRFLADAFELLFKFFQILIGKIFKIDQFVSRVFERADDLVELQLKCLSIAVLRVLNEEHHQEGDDGRASINDKLPCVRKMKRRPGRAPDNDDQNRNGESPCAAQDDG